VGVVGSGSDAADVARLLRLAGVGRVERRPWASAARDDVVVVAPAVDELDRLGAWNDLALFLSLRWLPVRPFDGRIAAVGPIVVPHESACFECLLLRRATNLEYGRDLHDVDAAPSAASADVAVELWASALVAHLVLRWLGGGDRTIAGVMFAIETRPTPAVTEHPVLRVPRCPACSRAQRRAGRAPWHEAAAA
jgi:bacteriocin biosynthesis cyclodehydratase domain-containing protein